MRRVLAGVAAIAVLGVGGSQAVASTRGFDPDPAFPVGHISGTVSHQIPRLERVASTLAGRRAVVNCWSNEDWTQLQAWEGSHHYSPAVDAAGLTYPETHRIQLSPTVCQVLAQVIARSARQPLFTAWAVTILAHESAHVSGIAAENRAECRAIATEPRAAALLGVARPLARRLQHIYRGTLYPYDVSRYRTPPCPAGRPGVVVSDTLGDEAHVRPLEDTAAAVVRALPPWKDIGGANGVGPLSPCSPIRSRAQERARFGETLLGPSHEVLSYGGTTLKTGRDFASALTRFETLERCDLRLFRLQIRELHSGATASLASAPAAIANLSPQLDAFRIVYTAHGEAVDHDKVFLFEDAARTMLELEFVAPAGTLPVSLEARAASALLQGGATMARRSGR